MNTPWGAAQTVDTLGPGVRQVTTAGHGGIHLGADRNALVHAAWRDAKGWYEEDCEWAIVAVTFPNLFKAEHVIAAHRVAKDYYPDEYEKVFQVALLPAESYGRREQIFRAETVDKLVVTSAWGSGQSHGGREPVPDGMVGVLARPGGRGGTDHHWLLVPSAEYREHGPFGFVIDEQRHGPWPLLPSATDALVN